MCDDSCHVEDCIEPVYMKFTWNENVDLIIPDGDVLTYKKGDQICLCKSHCMLVFPFLVRSEDLDIH